MLLHVVGLQLKIWLSDIIHLVLVLGISRRSYEFD